MSKGIDRAAGAKREVVGKGIAGLANGDSRDSGSHVVRYAAEYDLTAPATDAARQWEGWGTALKPACEPIVLARKPLSKKTVAANVLKWGTGAINIEACRIGTESTRRMTGASPLNPDAGWNNHHMGNILGGSDSGRWPANVIHDGSEEVLAGFPHVHGAGSQREAIREADGAGSFGLAGGDGHRFGDEGSAARFFYCAKASKKDRAGSKHPTVKPIKLLQYLVRLVTPKGGLVLDPFAGSGTMAEATALEGMRCILIEREPEYQEDIKRRMSSSLTTLMAG